MVDACGVGVFGAEKYYLATVCGELFEGLLAEAVCDTAASILLTRGHFADTGETRFCTRGHDAARAGKDMAVSFEEDGVTVVFGFFAEEDADGDVGVFRSEYLFPEVEKLSSQVFADRRLETLRHQLSKPPCIPPLQR